MSHAAVEIHPTAVIADGVVLGAGVEIGAYSVIGPHARIGDGTKISSHVLIEGHTRLGRRCAVGNGACLGTPPQDRKYKGDRTFVVIGDDNILREYVTVNAASVTEGSTVIGDRNYLMIGSHVGHDCRIGSDVTIANGAALGGFVVVEDHAVIGGLVGIHQFCRVGRFAMVGGLTKVTMDVAPYAICDGNPPRFFGLNAVGLKRAGYKPEDLLILKKAAKELFLKGATLAKASAKVEKEWGAHPDVKHLLAFVRSSKRGMIRGMAEA